MLLDVTIQLVGVVVVWTRTRVGKVGLALERKRSRSRDDDGGMRSAGSSKPPTISDGNIVVVITSSTSMVIVLTGPMFTVAVTSSVSFSIPLCCRSKISL